MKIRFTFLLLATLLLASCSSRRKTVANKKRTSPQREVVVSRSEVEKKNVITKPSIKVGDVKQSYIETYSEIAIEEMHAYRIPASITLAQGILESSSGKSELTQKSNNHFGIKCHSGWKGKKTYHDDDEKGECFRVYMHPSYSFRDHSLFLSGRKRYLNLFKLDITDYVGWAKGLRKAGYATDKAYPRKLIKIIEDYELYKYDAIALGKSIEDVQVQKKNAHIVVKGDTLYSIAKKYKLSVSQLKQINGIESNTISIGQKLYVNQL